MACAISLDLSAPLYYKKIANGLAAPYSEATLNLLFDNLKRVALIYSGLWLSWRLLEIAIIPLAGGGINLLEKRCFDVLKIQKNTHFLNLTTLGLSVGLMKNYVVFLRQAHKDN